MAAAALGSSTSTSSAPARSSRSRGGRLDGATDTSGVHDPAACVHGGHDADAHARHAVVQVRR